MAAVACRSILELLGPLSRILRYRRIWTEKLYLSILRIPKKCDYITKDPFDLVVINTVIELITKL